MPTGCLSCHLVRISRACTTAGLGSDKRTPLLRDAVRAPITFPVTNVCCFQSRYAQVSQQLLACTFLFSARLKKPPSLLPMGAARVPAGSELQAPWVQGVGPAAGSPGELCQQELPAPLGPSSLSSRSPSPYAPTLHLHSKVTILH